MAEKVDLSGVSVAYFDQGVEGAGFYTLEGDTDESEVQVQDGMTFHLETVEDEDGNKAQVPRVDELGRPVVKSKPKTTDTLTVSHESNMKPDKRVYPSRDGDGFQYDDPAGEEDDNG